MTYFEFKTAIFGERYSLHLCYSPQFLLNVNERLFTNIQWLLFFSNRDNRKNTDIMDQVWWPLVYWLDNKMHFELVENAKQS